jgi:hypothetical protein
LPLGRARRASGNTIAAAERREERQPERLGGAAVALDHARVVRERADPRAHAEHVEEERSVVDRRPEIERRPEREPIELGAVAGVRDAAQEGAVVRHAGREEQLEALDPGGSPRLHDLVDDEGIARDEQRRHQARLGEDQVPARVLHAPIVERRHRQGDEARRLVVGAPLVPAGDGEDAAGREAAEEGAPGFHGV